MLRGIGFREGITPPLHSDSRLEMLNCVAPFRGNTLPKTSGSSEPFFVKD